MLTPSLKRIYKAQEEILQQGGLKTHQEKMMRSTLHTLKGMTIVENRTKKLILIDIIRGRELKAKKVHLRGHNLVISKSGGEFQTP